jgi:hypothetical protein
LGVAALSRHCALSGPAPGKKKLTQMMTRLPLSAVQQRRGGGLASEPRIVPASGSQPEWQAPRNTPRPHGRRRGAHKGPGGPRPGASQLSRPGAQAARQGRSSTVRPLRARAGPRLERHCHVRVFGRGPVTAHRLRSGERSRGRAGAPAAAGTREPGAASGSEALGSRPAAGPVTHY